MVALAALVVSAAAAAARARDGVREDVYSRSAHGDPREGVSRRHGFSPGDCLHCHTLHGPKNAGFALAGSLFSRNDNRLCGACHAAPDEARGWPGLSAYEASVHARSSRFVWPGPNPPARKSLDSRGLCLNCHTPHGVADERGLVPHLLVKRGDGLCLACHGDSGAARTNVVAELKKPSSHPTDADLGFSVGGWKTIDKTRHASANVSCVDCHDPHLDLARHGGGAGRSSGLERYRVEFGSRASPYRFTPLSPSDPDPAGESAACLRCHAEDPDSPRPTRRDVALEFHPRSASFHDVFASGRDSALPDESFEKGWSSRSRLSCGDCHGSDDSRVAGPHGSRHEPLLKKEHARSTATGAMRKDDLCLSCHRADVYLGGGADPRALMASRFNPPSAAEGHAFHSGAKGISCYACHESHGSRKLPSLLAESRTGGLTLFQATPDGGRCSSACHSPETYRRNARR